MVRVGLTGGIASGKTTVAALLAARGAVIIDADVLAREVVEPGSPGLARVVDRFGSAALRPDGSMNRAAIGAIVFADEAARRDLESIIHPLVRARAADLTERAAATPSPPVAVVQVIPLLVETGQAAAFDCCVVVDLDEITQRDRLIARAGLAADEAEVRIAAQATRGERLAAATWVIDNGGTSADLPPQVDRLWQHLLHHRPHS